MKTEHRQIAEAADEPAAISRADGVSGILDHPQPMLGRDRLHGIHIHRETRRNAPA